ERRGSALPFAILPLLQSGQNPSAFSRKRISRSACFYTANRGARTLLVALCGNRRRPGVPTSFFLQMLNEDLYDVLLLSDDGRLHYDKGVKGFSRSLLDTARQIRTLADHRGHEKIITFGTSMGGPPALRIGLLLQAERAIS